MVRNSIEISPDAIIQDFYIKVLPQCLYFFAFLYSLRLLYMLLKYVRRQDLSGVKIKTLLKVLREALNIKFEENTQQVNNYQYDLLNRNLPKLIISTSLSCSIYNYERLLYLCLFLLWIRCTAIH